MTSTKHNKGATQRKDGLMTDTPRPPGDLERNPGIGSSKGTFGRGSDPKAIEGDHTFEGDVSNDVTPEGAVNPGHTGRTNK